jgi:hypothetical protein
MQIIPVTSTYIPNVGIIETGCVYFPGKSSDNGDTIIFGNKTIHRIPAKKRRKTKNEKSASM